jgi:hypothetical protein
MCLLDDKGDPTTTCASVGNSGSKDLGFYFAALAAQGFDADKSLQDTDPFKDLFSDDPPKDPLAIAEASYSSKVKNLFDEQTRKYLWDKMSHGERDDAIVTCILDAKNCNISKLSDIFQANGFVVHPSTIAQTRATNVNDTGKPRNIGAGTPVPKVSVQTATNSSAQFQARIPPSGAECFRADGWQLLLQTFWNPPAYLDPTSSSNRTCVK